MPYLLFVSLLWAFSFGLIKRLTGLDGAFISAARLGLELTPLDRTLAWTFLEAEPA